MSNTRHVLVGSKSNRRVIVRELYLRDDISCRSYLCNNCNSELPSLLSSCGGNIYFIPDVNCVLHYFELFENAEIKNVILLDSVLNQVKSNSNIKIRYRIKDMLHNPSKCFISFPNEICKETFTKREKIQEKRENDSILTYEPIDEWIIRSIRNSGRWFQNHLKHTKEPPKIIILHSDNHYKSFPYIHNDILEYSLDEAMCNIFKNNNDIITLYESLKDSYNTSLTIGNEIVTNEQQYSEHLLSDVIHAGLKSGILYSGKIQVNKYYTQEATVKIYNNDHFDEIFIPSSIFQNRAIHGDDVAIELLPKSAWKLPKRKLSSPSQKVDDTNIVTTNDDENDINYDDISPTGRVVGIIQRNWRLYSATLQDDRNDSGRLQIAVPMDIRIPKVRIALRNANELNNNRLSIRIDDWPLHSQYPNGHYVSNLGKIGDIDTETKALMIENDITLERDFSQSCMQHLPSNENEWKITDKDLNERRDLRSRLIMSIDPPKCEDIDDALSIHFPSELIKGKKVIEIGVHIADVTHFVPPNSLLDREARERGTSVYLADRRMDMLPLILSAQLCSLREQQDRFAMSVLWYIDINTFEIIDIWFGKTIIFSSHEFSYQTADAILNNNLPTKDKKQLDIKTGRKNEYNNVKSSLQKMLEIARKYRKGREDCGSLELHSTEVKFEMTDQKTPTNIHTKQSLEVMKMVEEYMILANQSVAERIYKYFPECSLLRNHPHPNENDFYSLLAAASDIGYSIDVSSNKTLAQSLNKCVTKDPSINNILRMLATKAMAEAKYFVTGDFEIDEFYHYGLAATYYTHFTSPIRRYADIIVHRLLCESIKKENGEIKKSIYSQKEVGEICNHINNQNRNAKLASMDSTKLFHGLYFKSQQESNNTGVTSEGIIFSIKSNSFIVLVPEYGIKGPVYLTDNNGNNIIPNDAISSKNKKYKNIQLSGNFTYDKQNETIKLGSNKEDIEISRFFHCIVEIGVTESRIRWPSITLTLQKILMEGNKEKITTIKPGDLKLPKNSVQSSKLQGKHNKLMQKEDNNITSNTKNSIYTMFEQFRTISI